MNKDFLCFWHKESYEKFVHDLFPRLLSKRIPLSDYSAEHKLKAIYTISICISTKTGSVTASFKDIPSPSEEGVFSIDDRELVVVPIASGEDLEHARIQCVGELLYEFFSLRISQAPPELQWDTELLCSWFPLNLWMTDFFEKHAQVVDNTNWLSRQTHLRRILIPDREKVYHPGQVHRVCPVETPEGPNIGKPLTVSRGAQIMDNRIVVIDDSPLSSLGISASFIPFLEYNESARVLMGTNMMRQWIRPKKPEPALVCTGVEPDSPEVWCGRNLLTAFISMGKDTFEDGIVISESCANKLSNESPVEIGDKLSNRHGTKGVVSRILPDNRMPCVDDGRRVEIIFSFIGLHTRMNTGQLKEAVMGNIAEKLGKPVIVPPFNAPADMEIIGQLKALKLPESGMSGIKDYKGKMLSKEAAAGIIYWGRTVHIAKNKIMMFVSTEGHSQRQGVMELRALMEAGAYECIRECLNTTSTVSPHADTLVSRVEAGPVFQSPPPCPLFLGLKDRLDSAGIKIELCDQAVSFSLCRPHGKTLKLAVPVPHPYIRDKMLEKIGIKLNIEGTEQLVSANRRLESLLNDKAPQSLISQAQEKFLSTVADYFNKLVTPEHLVLGNIVHSKRVVFSGRTVITPGSGLRIHQAGMPEEMAWGLFTPFLKRTLQENEIKKRTVKAVKSLDELMSKWWIILNRAPTLSSTALIAFQPVRVPGNTIRLHPLVCRWMNADFDGDQEALFVPVTDGAKDEASKMLSVQGHLRRDSSLIHSLIPSHEALWGLAHASLTGEGKDEIQEIAGFPIPAPEGFITKKSLAEAFEYYLKSSGIDKTLIALERLADYGFKKASDSGASMSPFMNRCFTIPPKPADGDEDEWKRYRAEVNAIIAGNTDYSTQSPGAQLLAVKSGARGRVEQIVRLISCAEDDAAHYKGPSRISHGISEGLDFNEFVTLLFRCRETLYKMLSEWLYYDSQFTIKDKGCFSVFARARRSLYPGIVFAQAALKGEKDTLHDTETRLFVGLHCGKD